MYKKKTAFTFVELIVTVIILMILSTITYISIESYNKNARDSVRMNDISILNDSLKLYYTDFSTLPDFDDGTSINFSGAEIWKQGSVGEDFTRKFKLIKNLLTDPRENPKLNPKANYQYTYSILNNKKEFQFSTILEGDSMAFDLNITNNFINKTYAYNNDLEAYAYIKGNYNKQVVEVNTGGVDYILAIPTIITSDLSETDIYQQFSQNKLVYNSYNNLPASYSGIEFKMNSGFSFGMNNIVAYSGSIDDLRNYGQERLKLANNLKNIYSNSNIYSESEYDILRETTIDIASPSSKSLTISDNIVKRLGYMPKNLTKIVAVDTEGPPTVWGDIPEDLTLMFATGSIYVDTWTNNSCTPESMSVVEVSPGTHTLTDSLAINTIYKLSAGDYIISTNSPIELANCSAIIGDGNTNLFSSVEITGNTNGLIKGDNISNSIVYGINLDGLNDGVGGSHDETQNGIYTNNIDNSTIGELLVSDFDYKGINIYNSNNNYYRGVTSRNTKIQDGIYIDGDNSDNNSFYDITCSNNNESGIDLRNGDNNSFISITSSGNSTNGIVVNNNSSGNSFSNMNLHDNNSDGISISNSDENIISNTIVFNNGSDGIEINSGDNNIFTNVRTYNNDDNGVYLNNGADGNTFNNTISFNNGRNGIFFEDSNSDHNVVNNSVSFNNNQRGLYIFDSRNNVINNSVFYNNGEHGVNIFVNNSYGNEVNNIYSFNNNSDGIRGKNGGQKLSYYGNALTFSNGDSGLENCQAGISHSIFSNGIPDESGTFSDLEIIIPGSGTWGTASIGKQATVAFDGNESFSYGLNLANQSQLVRYSGTTLEFYGTDGVEYDSSKKVGQW